MLCLLSAGRPIDVRSARSGESPCTLNRGLLLEQGKINWGAKSWQRSLGAKIVLPGLAQAELK